MNSKPLVTIILPAYNAAQFIGQAVESVIAQTYNSWELIIINDGSTDETAIYLDSISHTSIQVIHQHNRGVSAARNVGLSKAKGEYITFLDADDFLPPRSLEVRSGYLQNNPKVDVVDGDISVRDESLFHEHRLYKPYYKGKLLPRLLRLDARVFYGPFYMFRKNKLCGTKFSEQMTHAEDILFFMTMANNSNVIYGFVSGVVYNYRRSNSSAMSNIDGLDKGYVQLLKDVSLLNQVTLFDQLYLRIKVAKILFLCWLSQGKVYKAIIATLNCFFMSAWV
jgi:teichuronic acid biosynthesis glycosyltransferase TuaG